MRLRRPLLLAALLVIAALTVSACGDGPSKEQYEAGLGRVQVQLEDANAASKAAAAKTDPAERSAAMKEAQAAIVKAADTAEGLKPPDDVKAEHEQLTTALREYATLFGKLAVLKDDDPARTDLIGQAGEVVEQLDAANRALEKAGYEVATSKAKGDDE